MVTGGQDGCRDSPALIEILSVSTGLIMNTNQRNPDRQSPKVPEGEDLDRLLNVLRKVYRQLLRCGTVTPKAALDVVLGGFPDPAVADVVRPGLERAAHEDVDALLQEQATWPEVTDCDRLDAAFKDLGATGIVTRQQYTNSKQAGVRKIRTEIKRHIAAGDKPRGFVFYDGFSCLECKEFGHDLVLYFGSIEKAEPGTILVGLDIMSTLWRHGLKVQWDWNPKTPIAVRVRWQRRLLVDHAAGPESVPGVRR
jgi:hypothetical protein